MGTMKKGVPRPGYRILEGKELEDTLLELEKRGFVTRTTRKASKKECTAVESNGHWFQISTRLPA
jgi:hypothetical protein